MLERNIPGAPTPPGADARLAPLDVRRDEEIHRIEGGPVAFTGATHRDLPKALAEIGDDRTNMVLVITGTGDAFMDAIDGDSLGQIFKPAEQNAASARHEGPRLE
ncbi:MAG: hypothetical protein AB7U18_03910 [Dehalococcoidia bacterium]